MDSFQIFEYHLADAHDQGNILFLPLMRVKLTKINIHMTDTLSCEDPQNVTEYNNLHSDLTDQKILFRKMLQQIVKSINDVAINFVNVSLVCQDIRLFTEIIPRECRRRQICVPYVLTNFLDIKEIVRNAYQCPYKRLDQIVEFLNIYPIKEAQTKSQTQLIERILKKLYQDRKLVSTSQKFIQKHNKATSEVQKGQTLRSKFYKVIGLPFKSFPAEILQILAPEVPQNLKEICFIYDRERFTGKAMVKIPEDYEPFLIRKNRMYIGPRYIELEASTQQEFERAKITLQQKSAQRSPPRQFRDPRERHREFYNIGHRRERSQSPVDDRRSREKHAGYMNEQREQHVVRHPPVASLVIGPGEYGIKVRGLPFAFTEWDVENIFQPYNMIVGSVKLGIKPGTTMKNGQAVILMRNYNDAQKALDMNGFRCMGRYLQVRVIGKDDYLRYK